MTRSFWDGERFELLGTLASYAIPILVAAAVGIGLFATSTYNEVGWRVGVAR